VTNPSGDRQGGSRGTPAARLWSQASRRAADGLPGPVARSNSGHPHVRVTNPTQTATLETEICGQRLSAARAANGARRRPERLSRPTDPAASRGNVGLFCSIGNHVDLRGLPGGAEGIQTDGHRGLTPRVARFAQRIAAVAGATRRAGALAPARGCRAISEQIFGPCPAVVTHSDISTARQKRSVWS
jgi:hypothetical protein